MKNLLLTASALLLFTSCAAKKSTATVTLSSAAFSTIATLYTGGAVVIAHNKTTSMNYSIPVSDSTFEFDFTEGNWNFMALGWTGATIYSGDLHCGVAKDIKLPATEPVVGLSLSKVDNSAVGVVDSVHPCYSFFKTLTTIDDVKICDGPSCDGSFVHYGSGDVSIYYGIPFFKGYGQYEELKHNFNLLPEYSQCSTTTSNVSGVAKFSKASGVTLPTKTLGGFILPFIYEVYDGTATCDAGDATDINAAVIIKSFGEENDSLQTIHSININSIVVDFPSPPFEIGFDFVPPAPMERNTDSITKNYQLKGPNGDPGAQNYNAASVAYECKLKSTSNTVWRSCPSALSNDADSGGDIGFNTTTGILSINGSTNKFKINEIVYFKFSALSSGAAGPAPWKNFSITMNPIIDTIFTSSFSLGSESLNRAASSSWGGINTGDPIDIFYSSSPTTGSNLIVSDNGLSGQTCTTGSSCDITFDSSSNNLGDNGNISISLFDFNGNPVGGSGGLYSVDF